MTVLRCANVLGPDVDTSHIRMLSLPLVPMILGFDPRYQFVHEDDVVHALEHAAFHDMPGIYNIAADGVLALSEVIDLLGKRPLPLLPPWGTGLFVGPLRRLGFRVPDEMLSQMRFGRGLDNRRLKAEEFRYQYTSREAVLALGEHLRLSPVLAGIKEPYRYEREVEEFLRWSPHVRREGGSGAGERVDEEGGLFEPSPPTAEAALAPQAEGPPTPLEAAAVPDPSLLESEEAIALFATLDESELDQIERLERSGRARDEVLEAIEGARGHERS